MKEETEVYLDSSEDAKSYVESLVNSRQALKNCPIMLAKLDEVILAELELALMCANQAKSEILKTNKDNIKPIKG